MDQKGFSFIELLVVMGIFSVFAVAGIQLTTNSFKGIQEASHRGNALNVQFELSWYYKKVSNCNADFLGVKVDPSKVGSTSAHQKVNLATHANYLKNYKSLGLETKKVSLTLKEDLGSDYFTSFIHLYLQTPGGKKAGNKAAVIPLVLKINPTNKKIERCISGVDQSSVGEFLSTGGPSPFGVCQNGYVMQGISSGGIVCTATQTSAAIDPSTVPGAKYSEASPGPGCTGARCSTSDFGPCYGPGCRTNGNYCDGARCRATGSKAECDGSGCCAGPSCL